MSRPASDPSATLPPARSSAAAFLVLTMLAIALGVAVAGDGAPAIDITVLEAIQAVDLPGVRALVTLSNLLFSTGGAMLLAVLFTASALLLRRADLLPQLVVVIALRLAGEIWKPMFDSPRPGVAYQPDPSLVSSTLGYPSGHSQTAAVVASMLVIYVHALELPRAAKWGVYAIAVGVTTLALFSRIHIGAHWPSDTVGGVLFGLATVALMQLVVRWLQGRVPSRRHA